MLEGPALLPREAGCLTGEAGPLAVCWLLWQHQETGLGPRAGASLTAQSQPLGAAGPAVIQVSLSFECDEATGQEMAATEKQCDSQFPGQRHPEAPGEAAGLLGEAGDGGGQEAFL